MGGGGGDDDRDRQAGMSNWERVGVGLLTSGLSEIYLAGRNYVADTESMERMMAEEQDRAKKQAEEMEARVAGEERERTAQKGLLEERNRQRRRLRAGRGSQGREGTILTQMGEGGSTALGDDSEAGKTLLGV